MARPCTICTHEQRNEIKRAVVLQTRYRKIATLYSVSESAISKRPMTRRVRHEHIRRASPGGARAELDGKEGIQPGE